MEKMRIVETASYVPDKVVTNDDLSKIMDTSDEWITARTGIKERRISLGENTSDLCTKAALKLLKQSGWSAESLDMIIVATMSPDSYTPATAAIVQGNIGASHAFCFDISAACSGFVYGMQTAAQFLKQDWPLKILLLGGEVLSKVIDWSDRGTAVLFGDGAAGVLLDNQYSADSGLLASVLETYGDQHTKLTAGQTKPLLEFPPQRATQISPFEMDGQAVYKFATHAVPKTILAALKQAELSLEDVDHFVLHQANARIIKAIAKRLHQPLEKFPINIQKYGNTSAASEPLLLDELVASQQIKRGDIIVLSGFGGGLTVGTQIIKY
ncbi:3-oxoacyl-ACP synthase 3 [Ligilactobacillus salitolerans]|uniref:Beta-ketoacyl-[acyl-carrier-protein] synthase III n=1 Tax=Ligilactobacillus salitolerans TaxID=1808352 RepID=A0A401ISR3_9LACO|nr:beta-ketoacyl-ACP synthase III [Ligilactobacillus salitolerans]GBG94580.1 3-oxoacyl-ACP synthase 3 [Ligilactobacillus salitolerans]